MIAAQDRQKHYADKARAPHDFKTGDQVLLSTRNLKFRSGVKKLHPRYIGPFPILGMAGQNAARLQLPPAYEKIHPVFHVSLLKPFQASGTFHPLPPPEVVDGVSYYEVEKILSTREKKSGRRKVTKEYLVKWRGYDDTHNSWEPAQNLSVELLRELGASR
jgi:hypothetical protein